MLKGDARAWALLKIMLRRKMVGHLDVRLGRLFFVTLADIDGGQVELDAVVVLRID